MLKAVITLRREDYARREDSARWETVTVSTAPEVFHEKDHFWPRTRLVGCRVVATCYVRHGRGYFPMLYRNSCREGAVEFAQMLIRAGFSLVK